MECDKQILFLMREKPIFMFLVYTGKLILTLSRSMNLWERNRYLFKQWSDIMYLNCDKPAFYT